MLRGVGVAGRGIKSHVERGGGLGLPTGESRAMLRGVGVGVADRGIKSHVESGGGGGCRQGIKSHVERGGGWGCRQGNQEPC